MTTQYRARPHLTFLNHIGLSRVVNTTTTITATSRDSGPYFCKNISTKHYFIFPHSGWAKENKIYNRIINITLWKEKQIYNRVMNITSVSYLLQILIIPMALCVGVVQEDSEGGAVVFIAVPRQHETFTRCWVDVEDAGPTLAQHRVKVSWLPGNPKTDV